jgi:hypothetical protein
MDQSDAITQARRFADTAYSGAMEGISRQYQQELQAKRAELAARGLANSGPMMKETARIMGQQVEAMVQARLDALLEGYELHRVQIDDELTASTTEDVMKLRDTLVASVQANAPANMFAGTESHYPQMLAESVGVSLASIKTQIERKRLAPKKSEAGPSITVYHVEGDNARWNVNSSDHSVNVVIKPSEQIFANMRQQIESRVPEGAERTDILERLTALEKAQGSSSFAQRYTEFISAAANHMQLLGPFIPALTEMLHKALG